MFATITSYKNVVSTRCLPVTPAVVMTSQCVFVSGGRSIQCVGDGSRAHSRTQHRRQTRNVAKPAWSRLSGACCWTGHLPLPPPHHLFPISHNLCPCDLHLQGKQILMCDYWSSSSMFCSAITFSQSGKHL